MSTRFNGELVSPSLARWTAFVFTLAHGLNIGGALLATVVIFPVWSRTPSAATGWDGRIDEAAFFVVVAPVAMVLAIATFAASWRADPPARAWMRIASVLYAIFFVVTMAYFLPEQLALKGAAGAGLPSADLASRLERWTTLNWLRQCLGLVSFAATVHALGLTYRAPLSAADARVVRESHG